MRTTWIVAFAGALLWAPSTWAHESVPHEIEEVSERMEEEGRTAELLLYRAELWRIEDRHTEALADVARARNVGAGAEADLLEGRIELEAGRFVRAWEVLNRYLAANPSSFRGHWFRGRARAAMGDTAGALLDYEMANSVGLALDVVLERGELLRSAGRNGEAIAHYQAGLEALGGSEVIRAKLWEVLMDERRWSEAVHVVGPALDRGEIDTLWLLRRAAAHAALGDVAAAQVDRRHALEDADRAVAKRRSPLNLTQRAEAHAALGNEEAARRDVNEAVARAPKFAAARELQARIRGAR